jgi:predicted phosphodiesterase
MRYAILSDIHGRRSKLRAVLADAQSQGAHRIVSLGDVGGDDCLALLRQAGATATFGNYEVSGWRRLAPEHQIWVQSWPPLLSDDGFLAVHATPWRPEGLHTIKDFANWLKKTRRSWRALFPYLTEDEDHLWQALHELARVDKPILFHGHTHQQSIWHWREAGRLRRLRARKVNVQAGHRYMVGVGSVGLPEDGSWAAYTLYDAKARCVELIRLDQPPGW